MYIDDAIEKSCKMENHPPLVSLDVVVVSCEGEPFEGVDWDEEAVARYQRTAILAGCI